jgi:hypothetical protein
LSVRKIVIPGGALTAEIEFIVAYLRACNPGRDLTGTDRKAFAEQITALLLERADAGLSGMRVMSDENDDCPASTS